MKNRKVKKRKRRLRLFPLLVVVFFLLGCGWYFLSLPLWSITTVVVNGTQILSPDDITAMAGIPISDNLFFTSFARARSNLKKITAIEKFHIYRIPPGTVLINITERRPLAAVVFAKQSTIIDAQGYLVNRNPNIKLNIPNLVDLPVVFGFSEEALKSDKLEPAVTAVINQIISKLAIYFKAQHLQIDLGGLENINLRLDDLLLVKIGSGRDIAAKMAVFEALLPKVKNQWQKVEYIDVRYPDNPVIKFK
jgi:cell division protein FtsQ